VSNSVQKKITVWENLRGNKSLWIIAVVVLLILAILPSYYFYNQYQGVQKLLQSPSASADAQVKQLITEVGKLMILPTAEQPTIATVSDVTKLVDQPFFANAKNGDKVLIYTQSKKAILYRESINKIIEVAPVNIGSNSPAISPMVTPSVTQAVSATVVIYNGTTTSGLASVAESKIKASVAAADVIRTKDAKNNYSKTVVVDLTGKQNQVATELASLLGVTVTTTIPDGETNPNTDVLVIVGSDFVK
jgi:hypothetical protein